MPSPLKLSLFLSRISFGVFMLIWAVRKVMEPEKAVGVFKKFYFSNPSLEMVTILGAVQIAIILAFMAGAFKRVSYGLVFLMHLGSTLSTVHILANPFQSPNTLFWAAVPLVFMAGTLYACRDQDSFLSLSKT